LPRAQRRGSDSIMWPRAAVLIGLGYLLPVAWLWWVSENPPARARGEFGALGLLADVYWGLWVANLLCAFGLVAAFMALRRESTAMRGSHWIIMIAGLFGALVSGCAIAFAHT
jgi:hypothetical protein